ncbi:MAG TPA: hypothetical protein VMT11_14870 [Myxococcaceae bacterium]|nr:hypothetical protein [Myxococcaceae bacterium]
MHHSRIGSRVSRRLGALVITLGSSGIGCATAAPSPAAQRVIPVNGVPGPRCDNLGTVIGQSEARAFGATGEQLVSQATGDAMERAAARGATHIFLSPVTVRERDGAPFSATLTGVAFRCPPPSP